MTVAIVRVLKEVEEEVIIIWPENCLLKSVHRCYREGEKLGKRGFV